MILVHVKHFLNKDGQDYFSAWINEAEIVLKKFTGFISIKQAREISNPDACHLLLRFINSDQLKNWSKSTEHKNLLALLDPYRQKKQESVILEEMD